MKSKAKANTLVATLLTCGSLFGGEGVKVISHSRNADPTSEGWESSDTNIFLDSSGVSRGPISNDLATGLDAWYVESNPALDSKPAISGSRLTYSYRDDAIPTAVDWTLETKVRIAGSSLPISSVQRDSVLSVRYSDGSHSFSMYFDREPDGDPKVGLGGLWGTNPVYIHDDSGDADYHLYELRYDSATMTADLLVDGVEVISNYPGYASSAPRAVSWDMNVLTEGGGAPPGLRGHFNSVSFLVLTEPEIAVTEAGVGELESGVSAIDFGGVDLNATSVEKQFTISNSGNVALEGLALQMSGVDASSFSISSGLSAVTVEPGETATFGVVFEPSFEGQMNAILELTSNDGDESPFLITLSGTGMDLDRDRDGWSNEEEIEIGSDPDSADSRPGMARAIRSWGAGVPLASTRTPRNVVKVGAGYWHSMALQADGKVHAWGRNNWGKNSIPSDLGPVKEVVGGLDSTILVMEDGTITLLGSWINGNATPSNLTFVNSAGLGAHHAVVLHEDGTVTGWGASYATPPIGLSDLIAVACGEVHTLGLKSDGTVVAWGLGTTNTGLNREFGQAMIPQGLEDVIAISAGIEHSLALRASGEVVAWGRNDYGQTNVPPGLSDVLGISAAGSFSVALKRDGTLVKWGISPAIDSGGREIVAIAAGAGGHLVCAGNDGSVFCLGGGSYGQLNPPPVRRDVVAIRGYGSVGTSGRTSLLSPDGQVQRLGVPFPTQFPIGEDAYSGVNLISEGHRFSTVINDDGLVRAWAELGGGDTNVPTEAMNWKAMASGMSHTIALKEDGSVVGWYQGSAVTSNNGQADVPTDLPEIIDVKAGTFHSLALSADGRVFAWGKGAPGSGTGAQSTVPAGLDGVKAIAASDAASFALKTDGAIVAWGQMSPLEPPVDMGPVKSISAGNGHAVALLEDGTVRVWGSNNFGEHAIPSDLGGVSEVFAAGSAVFAITRELAPFVASTDLVFSGGVVFENLPAGAVVGTLSSVDSDQADEFTYSLVAGEGDSGNSDFAISGAEVVSSKVLDRSEGTERSIRVRVTDLAGNTFEKALVIEVEENAAIPFSDGKLDLNFGDGGLLTGNDFGRDGSVELSSDGKILITGKGPNGFRLLRYLADGSPDPTFGGGGEVTASFGVQPSEAFDVAIQPDGKYLVAGRTIHFPDNTWDFALARFLPDGSLDSGFGTAGKVTTEFDGFNDSAYQILLQDDGKIILTGAAVIAGFDGMAAVRYESDGSLDPTFGIGGRAFVDFGETENEFAPSSALQGDGKIVLAGWSNGQFAATRFDSDGRVDSGFGLDGRTKVAMGDGGLQSNGYDVVIQSDGKIVVVGSASIQGSLNFAILRLDHAGIPDPSFGTNGMVYSDLGGATASAKTVALQADGKIVAGGWKLVAANDTDFALARFLADGSVDESFGPGGWVTSSFGPSADELLDLKIDENGAMVAAGTAILEGGFRLALARYAPDDGPELPRIEITGPGGTKLENGVGAVDFGRVVTGTAMRNIITIRNVGTQTLSGFQISIPVSSDSDRFTIVSAPGIAGVIEPGGFAEVVIDCAPAMVGLLEARLEIGSSDPNQPLLVVHLAGAGVTAVEAASLAFELAGLSGDDALPEAAPFNDGVSNLLKYAFNMNIAGPDLSMMSPGSGTSGLPAAGLAETLEGTVLRVEFVRRKGSGLIYTPKFSDSLDAFQPMTGSVSLESIDGTWERITVDQPCDPTVTPRCFAVVEVALPVE